MVVELMTYTTDAEMVCGKAAAICTDSKKPLTALKHAVESGHTSVLEHAVFTFRVIGLSRAALAQLTRHRLASYDVQSQRYVRMTDQEPVIPESVITAGLKDDYIRHVKEAMGFYQKMVDSGIPCEDARYITPQAMPTILVMTMNARELLHFFALRTCNRAQWEIREMADMMLMMCKAISPGIFGSAGPGCVTGKCPEKKPCGHPRREEFE